MTRVMAVEWAQHNIQVNCICPGMDQDGPERNRYGPIRTSHAGFSIEFRLRRFGLPNELSGLTIYLASTAGNYTTGQVLYVDGGFTAGGQW